MNKFSEKVLEIVKKIPYGEVASYGQVAVSAGYPRGARQVGWILSSQGGRPGIPWWRVVNNKGYISIKNSEVGPLEQKALLESEGVMVNKDFTFDIEKYRAFLDPEYL